MSKCSKCGRAYTYRYNELSKKKVYKPACSCTVTRNKIKPLDAAFKKIDEWLKNKEKK